MFTILEHTRSQSSIRWATSRRCAACLYEPEMRWPELWRAGLERFVRSLAYLPRVAREPASRPQCGKEHRTGRAAHRGAVAQVTAKNRASLWGVSTAGEAACAWRAFLKITPSQSMQHFKRPWRWRRPFSSPAVQGARYSAHGNTGRLPRLSSAPGSLA